MKRGCLTKKRDDDLKGLQSLGGDVGSADYEHALLFDHGLIIGKNTRGGFRSLGLEIMRLAL